MNERLKNYLNDLVGNYLTCIKLVCQMIVLDFGKYGIHSQLFERKEVDDDKARQKKIFYYSSYIIDIACSHYCDKLYPCSFSP